MNWTNSQVEIMIWAAFAVATLIWIFTEHNRVKHLKHFSLRLRAYIFSAFVTVIVGLVAWHIFIPFAKYFLVRGL